jgi:hypothetical protein
VVDLAVQLRTWSEVQPGDAVLYNDALARVVDLLPDNRDGGQAGIVIRLPSAGVRLLTIYRAPEGLTAVHRRP